MTETMGVDENVDEEFERHKQKDAKHEAHGAEQEVTDPVTHSSVKKHDITSQELKHILENMPLTGSQQLSVDERPKNKNQLGEGTEGKEPHAGIERSFPPDHDAKTELIRTFRFAANVGMGVIFLIMVLFRLVEHLFDVSKWLRGSNEAGRRPWADDFLAKITLEAVVFGLGIWGFRLWVESKINDSWEDQVLKIETQSEREKTGAHALESTQWLNSVLASIWPLVNPDLFTSLADTLEDSMQSSLPKMVNMINVEDLGQGSEAPRILGVQWLPPDASAHSTSSKRSDGDAQENPKFEGHSSQQQDSNQDEYTKNTPQEGQEGNLLKVLEAEEGDFVCLEVAFAYRARPAGDLGAKAKNAHLFLGFHLLAGLHLPVWVEIQGVVGVLRLRLQLTPDLPFLARCTFTFMGQPKVSVSCMPMFRHGLNIMNLPVISSFVQHSVDAAMADYVAPKSLSLDLKEIFMTDDFKKDTNAHGVIVVRIKRAVGFKESDTGHLGLKRGSADPYVSVGWTKFGKFVWSTRVIVSEMEPAWDETGFIVVGREELNAQERLRVQLWDSNQFAPDGDLGFIDIKLNEVMQNPRTDGKMLDRRDKLPEIDTGWNMSCTLDWSLGYFSKAGIPPTQLASQTRDLKKEVAEKATKKLRESRKDESHEIEKQKKQGLKTREDEIIISNPPSPDYPSGICAIQIHQILGLGIKKPKRDQGDSTCEEDDSIEGEGDDLLSSYCTVILNHQRILRTRTKPKSAKPSFNVGVERFIRDWRTAEIILSVRDMRMHEHDPVIGVVVLPLPEIFQRRSQINDYFPLAGGIGHGRVRISMVFRSIQLQTPIELLGWEYGTLKVMSKIKSNDLPDHYKKLRLKLRTSVQSEAMSIQPDGWGGHHQGQSVELAVRQRYRSSLIVEFQEINPINNHIPAFAILWLKDIPDDEEKTMTLTVWKGDLKRAEANCEPENGENLGHIEIRLRFQPGISNHHKKLASKDKNLADVMEVVHIANNNKVKISKEEAVFESHDSISNHDSRKHSWPQPASKEHDDKLHQTAHKLMHLKSNNHTVQRAKHKVEDAGGHVLGQLQQHHEQYPPNIEPDAL